MIPDTRAPRAPRTEPGDGPMTVKRLEARLDQLDAAIVCSLTTVLDLKDLPTGMHATRLAEWAVRVAEQLGVERGELRDVEIASLLHDIGKVGIPNTILQKDGKLTVEEYEKVKKHPEYGWAVLRILPGFERVSLYVLHHHERVDGGGYPGGLRGEQIPLGARIVSVVDAFDAMTSSRAYRDGMPAEVALARLRAERATQFDGEIVDLFEAIARSYLAAGPNPPRP